MPSCLAKGEPLLRRGLYGLGDEVCVAHVAPRVAPGGALLAVVVVAPAAVLSAVGRRAPAVGAILGDGASHLRHAHRDHRGRGRGGRYGAGGELRGRGREGRPVRRRGRWDERGGLHCDGGGGRRWEGASAAGLGGRRRGRGRRRLEAPIDDGLRVLQPGRRRLGGGHEVVGAGAEGMPRHDATLPSSVAASAEGNVSVWGQVLRRGRARHQVILGGEVDLLLLHVLQVLLLHVLLHLVVVLLLLHHPFLAPAHELVVVVVRGRVRRRRAAVVEMVVQVVGRRRRHTVRERRRNGNPYPHPDSRGGRGGRGRHRAAPRGGARRRPRGTVLQE